MRALTCGPTEFACEADVEAVASEVARERVAAMADETPLDVETRCMLEAGVSEYETVRAVYDVEPAAVGDSAERQRVKSETARLQRRRTLAELPPAEKHKLDMAIGELHRRGRRQPRR